MMVISQDNDCALANYRTDVETFYRVRYELALHMRIWGDEVRQLEIQNDSDIQATWYELGLYEKRGHDYHGRSYRIVENDGSEDVEFAADGERVMMSEEARLYNKGLA